jgi:hypothetical protein
MVKMNTEYLFFGEPLVHISVSESFHVPDQIYLKGLEVVHPTGLFQFIMGQIFHLFGNMLLEKFLSLNNGLKSIFFLDFSEFFELSSQ